MRTANDPKMGQVLLVGAMGVGLLALDHSNTLTRTLKVVYGTRS